MIGLMGKGAYPSINQSDVESIKIPLPPLEVQKEIVAKIDVYQKEIVRLKSEITNLEINIQKEIANIWGKKDEQI